MALVSQARTGAPFGRGRDGHRPDLRVQLEALDPVKRMVAVALHHHMTTVPGRPGLAGMPEEAAGPPVGVPVGALCVMVRVPVTGRVRVFLIRVMETTSEPYDD